MIENYEVFIRLFLALILGALLGIERIHAGKNAGLRTFALVSMGSAFFMIISVQLIGTFSSMGDGGFLRLDISRIASGLIEGVGFLGAGMILFQKDHIANLTTAAGIWVAAAIGMATGFGFYFEAIMSTILVIFTFTLMWNAEHKLKNFFRTKSTLERNDN